MVDKNSKSSLFNWLLPWLDVSAILAWGVLLLKYWQNGKLSILIHPNYFWLTIAAGMGLLLIGFLKVLILLDKLLRAITSRWKPTMAIAREQAVQHVTIFPPGWSSTLLLATAILGLTIAPRAFTSDKALQVGINDFVGVTQVQPKSFRSARKPEERSLIEWVRTLTVYPEPDTYTGQKVKVQGFVIHSKELPDQYLMLARFVITCCAADAYPVGLPVKLPAKRTAWSPDTWLEVEGKMITETFGNKRLLTIQASSVKPIPEPKNPYDY